MAAWNHPAVLSPGLILLSPSAQPPVRDTFAVAHNYASALPLTGGASSLPIPYVYPFAAAHNFPGMPATTLNSYISANPRLQNYLRAQV